LNEEMQTVNAEFETKMRIVAVQQRHEEPVNGIKIATIFLDDNLAVKRFTPEATKIVNLAASDVGARCATSLPA